ncbi:hypothetical protein [Oceanobacillus sp. Castelsardo]|uniref:hypothetical protein n=1 Tax=Oceanobacillus sp. Castelsardo TaxID=1851204 RepID=UPI0008385F94|nr:hypothetical protein [Oceanobacillus sp. Castelsardo]
MKRTLGVLLLLLLLLFTACSNQEQTSNGIQEESDSTEKDEISEETNSSNEVEKESNSGIKKEEVVKLNKSEVRDILKENIDEITNVFIKSGEDHHWSFENPAEFEKMKLDFTNYATKDFINSTLKEVSTEFYCECDQIFLPSFINYDAQFTIEQKKEDELSVSAVAPATEIDNMGILWKIRLLKEENGWKINHWESESLYGKDIKLTKEEAAKLLESFYESPEFVKEYHSEEASGKAYVFKMDNYYMAISSKDTSIVYDYEQEEPDSEQGESFTYETYINGRFGFTVEHPTSFIEGEPPTNDDGREFSNGEATIVVYGGHANILEENETIETYYNRTLQDISSSIAYERLGDNWYVLSYTKGDQILYVKGVLRDDVIYHLRITYPVSKKDDYNSMVTRVSEDFGNW